MILLQNATAITNAKFYIDHFCVYIIEVLFERKKGKKYKFGKNTKKIFQDPY